MNNNNVSVIIPTKGVRNSIVQVIEHIAYEFKQVDIHYEIIVGLDSKDNVEILDFIKTTNNYVRIIKGSWYSPSKARNAAAKLAIGTTLVFIDDDIIVNKGWGNAVKRIICENGCDLWAGGIDCEGNSILSRKTQEQGGKCFGIQSRNLSKHEYGASGHLIVTLIAWKQLNGFNESFGNSHKYKRNEDVELFCKAHKMDIKAIWEPDLSAKHLFPKKLTENDHFEQGRSDFAIDYIYFRYRMIKMIVGYIFYMSSKNVIRRRRAQGYVFEVLSRFVLHLLSVKA